MTFLVQQTLIYAIPLMIVALAGVFAERSGIINLALEGIMIFGAFVGVYFVRYMQLAGTFSAAKESGNWLALQGLELLALLVERGQQGITSGEGIMCLWPDRTNDASTQSLFRMTYKRLAAVLEESGIGNILVSAANRRYLRVEEVDCDLYRILSGDTEAQKRYDGRYLQEYSWAEERNGQLYRMLIARE